MVLQARSCFQLDNCCTCVAKIPHYTAARRTKLGRVHLEHGALYTNGLTMHQPFLTTAHIQALMTCPVLLLSIVWSAGGVKPAVVSGQMKSMLACASLQLAVSSPSDLSQVLMSSGWTASSWVPVLVQALGGILVGHITKRLGGIRKGFAVVCGLIITGLLQTIDSGRPLSAELVIALLLVVSRYAPSQGLRLYLDCP